MVKIKAAILTRFLAVLAVGFLSVSLYADCADICGRQPEAPCCIDKTPGKPDSGCCNNEKPQPKNDLPGKCEGNCRINDLSPSATVFRSNAGFHISGTSQVCENLFQAESNLNSEALILSTGPPLYLHDNIQAVLCVFVI